MPEPIDERVRELQEILELLDTPPGREAWNTQAVRHMPAILDALERQRTALKLIVEIAQNSDYVELEILGEDLESCEIAAREALNEHQ